MNFKIIFAVMRKQINDTLKNKTILLQFIMFPVLTIIMANAVKIDDMPENFFVVLFGTMYIGMAPMTSMSSIISEEKENNTLRALMMSNVKAIEYLSGTSFYVIFLCIIGSLVIGLQGNYSNSELFNFMLFMTIGIIINTLIGAIVGVYSINQMVSTSISIPLMVVFSFFPMISTFNDSFKKVSKFIYSQQISDWINGVSDLSIATNAIVIVAVNAVISLILFIFFYSKKGLD